MDFSSVNILWCMDMHHPKGPIAGRHNHEFYHYIYVRDGRGRVTVDGQSLALIPHHTYVFNPLSFHEFSAEEELYLYEIKFEVGDEALAEGLSHLAPIIPTDPTEAERIFSSLLIVTDTDDAWSASYRRTLLSELLLILLRQSHEGHGERHDPYGLLTVVRYMRAHYGEELKNEDLATLLHMEKTYFIKQFKQRFGMPPRKYLMGLRMERAAALIENSGTSISKIAELCGFKSIHHFSNAYKQHFGVSPAAHREKHTKK